MQLWKYIYSVIWMQLFFQMALGQSAHPLFTENKGQWDQRILFVYKNTGQNVLIFRDGFAYDNYELKDQRYIHHRVEFRFENTNVDYKIEPGNSTDFLMNYYVEFKEILAVKSYKKVVFSELYDGVDLHFKFGPNGNFKYDFVVHPGAELSQIQFKVLGAPTRIVHNQLKTTLRFGELRENIPMSYLAETRKEVDVQYVQNESGSFGFKMDASNLSGTLVIDPEPELIWSTYFGGSGYDESYGSCLDELGNVYLSGKTMNSLSLASLGAYQSENSGNFDGLLMKFNSYGRLLWCTYYGGAEMDEFKGLKINHKNQVICLGNTRGSKGLASNEAHQVNFSGNIDPFIVKFTNNGVRIWATYFGGPGTEEVYRLALDADDNMYITGKSSIDGLATPGAHQSYASGKEDGILFSLNDNGVLRWCTYLGGSNQDYIWDIVWSSDNSLYFSGLAHSGDNIAVNAKMKGVNSGNGDVFYGKSDTSGNISWVNYFGGFELDQPIELATDGLNLFQVGYTESWNQISFGSAHSPDFQGLQDGFVFSFDTSGQILWSTYIGDGGRDEVYAIQATDKAIYLGGHTTSNFGIASSKGLQQFRNGGVENFMMKFTKEGTALWGTYFGGNSDDRVTGLSVIRQRLYLSGSTGSSEKISTENAFQTNYAGGLDLYVACFNLDTNWNQVDDFNRFGMKCMNIFSNPSNDYTQVIIPGYNPKYTVEVFDARGRLILELPSTSELRIEVSDWAKGMYFFRYHNCVEKFIKY